MTLTLPSRPVSQHFGSPSASTPVPGFDYRPQPRPAVRSHYRPHSTLFVNEQAPTPPKRDSLLIKSRRHSFIRRSVSLGETMGLGKKKATEQDLKDVKGKEKPQLPRLRNLSDVAPPPPPASDIMSRPSTSAGLSSIAERSSMNARGNTSHRVKAQRSITSLFAAAGADVSPDASEQIHHLHLSPPTHPPSAQRPRKMNVAASARPRAPSNPRQKRHSRQDYENAMNAKKKADVNGWVTRSRTTVHPYAKEVPYMQAYDIPCLENDRYTQLLLERLNPGSPSFLDFGKKPPSNALDLGCGQGEWCMYAASIWKHTRIVGFDLMDVTFPQFQATENLSFVQGNFLQKLPFPAKSFDYVRMANLSLCIPYTQWLPLLIEVHRLLTNGGRLELIDDQILFPYGEEPQSKETSSSAASPSDPDPTPIPAPTTPSEETVDYRAPIRDPSFFDFGSDSEPDLDEGFQDDDETTETSSTTSTLVSDRGSMGFYDKIPSWKRSSAQSTQSARSYASTTSTLNSERRFSDAPPPIAISITATPLAPLAPLESNPALSPSPTVTQATIKALDTASGAGDLSQTPTIKAKKHKKHDSGSSTKSNTDALVTWKHRKTSSAEMETIFEHILIHNYGIHPRPSEFMVDSLSCAFGQGNAGKTKSFHIKLAPFDSPIGPGGSQDPNTIQEQQGVDKKQLKKEKFDKKERKREHRRLEETLEQPYHSAMMPPPAVVTAKAASRLGLVPTVPPLPRGASYETPTSSPGSPLSSVPSSKRSSAELASPTSALPVVSAKAARRLGIPATPPPVPPKSEAIKVAYVYPVSRGGSPSEVPKPVDATIRLVSSKQVAGVDDYFGPMGITPTSSFRESDQIERNSSSSSSGSNGSGGSGGASENEQSSGSSSDAFSDGPLVPPPHVLSAKAAGRLGISYSVLAAASAGHSRSAGVMAPVQSPGLLVWPSTYIPMTPAELEMHACKWVQTLLGCRHAMREFITGSFNGEKLVDDDGFEEAIWDYECFRRSRFHWPNDNPELFANVGFPESPGPNSPNPAHQQSPTSPLHKLHGRNDSFESFNGQYRRNELTQARVIRVFEAVKTGDEKGSMVSMLFRG